MRNKILLTLTLLLLPMLIMARKAPVPVYIVAGQSNSDGRVSNAQLPDYIRANGYKHCYWSYSSGTYSSNGAFELFWPHVENKQSHELWAYDAVTNYFLEQALQRDFYVIKETLGGTAIDTSVSSTQQMYWSADTDWLVSNISSHQGGSSLLKALTESIDAAIDNKLRKIKGGYEIKALLWHQGESDRKAGKAYEKNLQTVISHIRTHLVEKTGNKRYANLPVIIGSIAHNSSQYSSAVEDAQIKLTKSDANIRLVDVHDASLQSDGLHFDSAGAELLGRKMFNELAAMNLVSPTAKPVSYNQRTRRIMLSDDGEAQLVLSLPDKPEAKRRMIIGIPGGGYGNVGITADATHWAPVFNKEGIAFATLLYRLPHGQRDITIGDAEKALRMARDSANVWNIDPQQIGVMGFSAGGHLASTLATHSEGNARPNFQILIYPVITFGDGTHAGTRKNFLGDDADNESLRKEYSNELHAAKAKGIPAIILFASDDKSVVPQYNAIPYYLALHNAGIPATMHAYADGGHGFGIKTRYKHIEQMKYDIMSWLRDMK